MKVLVISFICTFMCVSLFAQVDSANNTNLNSTQTTNMPAMNDSSMHETQTTTPAALNNNNPNMTNNSTNSTNGNMNNMNSTTSNSEMNMHDTSMNANLVNPNNIPGQLDYAALPVLETFVPENIVAQVKQKYPNEIIYDITAVKAPVDSSKMQSDSMAMHSNSTSMNQNTTKDSSMNQSAANNLNNGMTMDSTMKMPEKFNYVVRIIRGGQIMTETLDNDGTALNAIKNDGMNQ
ncbi:MAG: hypothetical protein ABIR50_11170 [Ginsengibacter sp.]